MRAFVSRLGALWQRNLWWKVALGLGASLLACCACAALGLAVNPPRPTATQPTELAIPPAELPHATALPVVSTAEPTLTTIPSSVPMVVPTSTAIPASPTPAVQSATTPPVRERGVMVREDLGDKWPLTVDAIRLRCVNGREVVFDAGGTTYALNGTAKGTKQYADLAPIWRDDPKIPGLKVSLLPLVMAGLDLC